MTRCIHSNKKETLSMKETVSFVLAPAVWMDLPWNEEGCPDRDQIESWCDLEKRLSAEEWFCEMEQEGIT